MPRQATEAEARAAAVTEVPLPEEATRLDVPLVRCRVIYLGAARNKSVAMTGTVSEEFFEEEGGPDVRDFVTVKDGERVIRPGVHGRLFKEAVDSGITSYDFSTHDARGQVIRSRLMPDTAPAHLRGKPFLWVEHLGHVRQFKMGPKDPGTGKRVKEYELLVPPETRDVVARFIMRATDRDREQEELQAAVRG